MGIIHTYLSIQTTRFWGPDFLDDRWRPEWCEKCFSLATEWTRNVRKITSQFVICLFLNHQFIFCFLIYLLVTKLLCREKRYILYMKCKDKYKNILFLNKLDFVLISQKSESIFLQFFFKCWILRKKKTLRWSRSWISLNIYTRIFMKTIRKINDPLYLFHFKSG